MPLYEYTCRDCGREFEELVPDADATVPCPHCGSGDADRLISACRARVTGGGPDPDRLRDAGCGAGGG